MAIFDINLDDVQETLVNQVNIKSLSVNGGAQNSLLGSGNLDLTIASGVSIGDSVGSGVANNVLFVGAGEVLAQDGLFNFNSSNKRSGFGIGTPLAIGHFKTQSATDIGLIIQGTTSQSGNLLEFRDVANNINAYVSQSGFSYWNSLRAFIMRGTYINSDNNFFSCLNFNDSNGNVTVYQNLIMNSGTIRLKSYTYATLPASPAAGDLAFVTDALLDPRGRYYFTLGGGGSYGVKVLYTGTAWVYA